MGKGSTNKSSKHQLLCCSNIKWKFHEISMLGSSSIQISVKTNPNFRRAMKPARSQLSGCHDFQLAKVRVRYTFKVGEKGDPVANHNFSQTNHQIQYYSIHLCLVFNDVTFKSYSIHGFSGFGTPFWSIFWNARYRHQFLCAWHLCRSQAILPLCHWKALNLG